MLMVHRSLPFRAALACTFYFKNTMGRCAIDRLAAFRCACAQQPRAALDLTRSYGYPRIPARRPAPQPRYFCGHRGEDSRQSRLSRRRAAGRLDMVLQSNAHASRHPHALAHIACSTALFISAIAAIACHSATALITLLRADASHTLAALSFNTIDILIPPIPSNPALHRTGRNVELGQGRLTEARPPSTPS